MQPRSSQFPDFLTANNNEFAKRTVTERLPIILTKGIDQLHRDSITEDSLNNLKSMELKSVISKLASLKYDMMHDRELDVVPLACKHSDIWNYIITSHLPLNLRTYTWCSAPWLIIECLMYKQIQACFEISQSLQGYDIFKSQKADAFECQKPQMLKLCLQMYGRGGNDFSDHKLRPQLLADLIQYSLWGNQCDLSLNLHAHQLTEMNGNMATSSETLLKNEKMLIINDLAMVLELLAPTHNVRIDIILDNAGFELFVDLLFADYLITSGIASTVVFHCKEYPYFVSDVTLTDFNNTIDAIEEIIATIDHNSMWRWRDNLAHGKWIVEADPFWTLSYSFADMTKINKSKPEIAHCWAQAKSNKSALAIFKGDLNYRKLVDDAFGSCSFATAIGDLAKDGIPILALRTCKSYPQAGLEPGQAEALDKRDVDWRINGKFGIIQFFKESKLQ